ncbi:MAG: fatty acid desaturase [Boseongicola sp. SB0664_bin_43]|uniref:Fatty acid desaturase n=1 Tax=Boseongicola sp. SB0664_bin_43 TaxID=2604844 RepID=A0A6B0Y1Y1_9RHOB|nr:fatty acid desaturase [Boseongicola sp. SB0664_bin_43]
MLKSQGELSRRSGYAAPVMDHKAFVCSVPANVLADLSRTEDAAGLRHLAMHLGLILALGLYVASGAPFWWLALLPLGIAICFLFTLQHEATHKTPFATPWLNEWAGRLAGVPILQPFEWFRYFHLSHHKHTNDPARDPELIAGAKPETWASYVMHVSGLPFWWAMTRRILANASGAAPGAYSPERARRRLAREARWMLLAYALAAVSLLFTPLLFWVWILPCLLGQPFLRLYLLAEHGRCAFVANMLQNTRTTYTNRLVRFLTWNMPYHVEHHTLPQVPFHKLPELHDRMQGWHQVTSDGYIAFTRDYAASMQIRDQAAHE